MTLIITTKGSYTGPDLGPPTRDRLLLGSNGGVLVVCDFNRAGSWPSQDAPVHGDTIYDLAEANDSSFNILAGQTLSFASGAIGFGAVTTDPVTIDIPAAVAADLWADEYFLSVFYTRLPSLANWMTFASGLKPQLTWAAGTNFTTETDIVSVGPFNSAGLKYIGSRRQTNGLASSVGMNVLLGSGDYGNVAQIGVWRNASGEGLQVRTVAGIRSASAALGVKNTVDFSAKVGKLGVTNGWSIPSADQNAHAQSTQIYRFFIENLATSGRNPVTVMSEDWNRHVSRWP
jgi:hypothetical protein